jgi:hypothetical protein|tara:strand:+ start:96 stop:461 length:366 start_codon:yes stop_codon:yes gene_type:complete
MQTIFDAFNEIPAAEQSPFSLPDAKVVFVVNGNSYQADAVELKHKLDLEISNLGNGTKLLPAIVIPLLQKIMDAKFNFQFAYSDAWYVYKMVDEKFDECKKKFEHTLTLPPISPEVSTSSN